MASDYLPPRVVVYALRESRPRHVPFKMFGSAKRQRLRTRTVTWITKARKLGRTL